MNVELPELPKTPNIMGQLAVPDVFTASQMQEYAKHAVLAERAKHQGEMRSVMQQWHDGLIAERERCALLVDDLAYMMENGAGDPEPGGRLRQASRNIRDPKCKPMMLDGFESSPNGGIET